MVASSHYDVVVVKKYSVQFVNASGRLSAPLYFGDNKPNEPVLPDGRRP